MASSEPDTTFSPSNEKQTALLGLNSQEKMGDVATANYHDIKVKLLLILNYIECSCIIILQSVGEPDCFGCDVATKGLRE